MLEAEGGVIETNQNNQSAIFFSLAARRAKEKMIRTQKGVKGKDNGYKPSIVQEMADIYFPYT